MRQRRQSNVRRYTLRPRLPRRLPYVFILTDQDWQDILYTYEVAIERAEQDGHKARALRLRVLQTRVKAATKRSKIWRAAEPEDLDIE